LKPNVVALFEFVGGSISKELVALKLRIQRYAHTTR